jgi:hypothetical protein
MAAAGSANEPRKQAGYLPPVSSWSFSIRLAIPSREVWNRLISLSSTLAENFFSDTTALRIGRAASGQT